MSPSNKQPRNKVALALWTPGPFADQLKSHFEVIVSEDQWKAVQPTIDRCNVIVLLAELKWERGYYSNLQGFDVLRRLRSEMRIRCPIVVCSFLPFTHFVPTDPQKSNPKYELLKAPGHTFLQLPFRPKARERLVEVIKQDLAPSLSEELLDDIADSLCDIKGLVHEIHHRLKNAVVVRSSDELEKSIKQRMELAVEEAIASLNRLFPGDNRVAQLKQRLIGDIQQNVFPKKQYRLAIDIVNRFSGDFERLTPAPIDGSPVMVNGPSWIILYIDDEPHLRERVQREFKKRNLPCVTASTAKEAFELLKNDLGKNSVTVVITDYRLETGGEPRRWQHMQGYSIIKEIFLSHSNFVSFFALTAASRRALLRIQKMYQVRVTVFSKEDVLSSEGGFNIFAGNVRREGERMFEVVCSQPRLTYWSEPGRKNKQPLKNYYRTHREMLDYDSNEDRINKEAKDYVDRIVRADKEGDKDPAGHRFDFQAELPQGPEVPAMLGKFRQRLIGRRIAIGLHILLGFTREKIYFAMRKAPTLNIDSIPVETRPKSKSVDALLSTALALSLEDDIPDHLLVEERSWLSDTMGVDLDESIRLACQKIEEDVVDDLREKLETAGCDDEFVGGRTTIMNFAAAKEALQKMCSSAERYELRGRFRDLLRECWDGATPLEQQALRLSGIYALMKDYVDLRGGEEPVA